VADATGEVLTHKVGPLPLLVWVAGGAGVVFLFVLMTHRNTSSSANATNSVSALAPTEAEAFGTIEQQQQDVVNALSTLGNNQSALGGSLSTLTGIITQQGADNAAAFQNLVNGQQTIEQGQTAASDQATSYYNSIASSLANYFSSVNGQLNGINSNTSQTQQNTLDLMQQNFKQYAASAFGYQSNLGGAAGYLALPQNAADFMHFLLNPSLADPKYQAQLMSGRGYVFESQIGATQPGSATGLTNLPIGQNAGPVS
jgi:hypothetical protein